ncbi:MAG: hypothetical protein Q7T59_01375 [Candidatus Woesebacteria bacterium]|nr:hypothetical protein [Candidatus Woesebacteria bacterium]
MSKEFKTHNLKIKSRRITILTTYHPDMDPPQTTYSVSGTLAGRQVGDVSTGGVFVGNKVGPLLDRMKIDLSERILNLQNINPRVNTEG